MGETNRETATRLMDLLQKWMKEHQTVASGRDGAVPEYSTFRETVMGTGKEAEDLYRSRRVQDANSAERRALLGREEAGKQNKGAIQNGICLSGTVKGQTKILLDNTRCSKTMVSNRLVPLENYLEGKGVSVWCAHGDVNFYP